jgi:alcohol dehydrogenase class IV
MKYEFATSRHIVFGTGSLSEIGSELKELGHSALLVIGANPERASKLVPILEDLKITTNLYQVIGEPTVKAIKEGIGMAMKTGCDMVIGIGGGSALDAGKAIAIMVNNENDLLDYLEVIGKNQAIKKPGLPYVAIPTTAGTGTEVTRNAVILAPEQRVKVSLRSQYMIPTLAVVDPTLSYSMSPETTASTGLDALTQLIEPFVCNKPNVFVDAFCREGILRISRSIKKAYKNGLDLEARLDMSLASLFSGIALANAKLGAVHGIAGPFGGMYSAPHGMICACLLPHIIQLNVELLRNKNQDTQALERYKLISQWVTGNDRADLDEGIAWFYNLNKELNIPNLAMLGINENEIDLIVEKSMHSSSMKGNPVDLAYQDVYEVLVRAMHEL